MIKKEIWKELPLDFYFENFFKVEVSNFGRVRTYNSKNPDSKIINGSLQGGYNIVRLKLFKARTEKVLQKIADFNQEVSAIQEEISSLKKVKESILENLDRLNKLLAKKNSLIKKRSAYIKITDKKRTINHHFLIHRAVAELFIKKEKDNQKLVIHKDFNKNNNHVDNLAWATEEETFDRYANNPYYAIKRFEEKLTGKKTPKVAFSKLKENEVLYIKSKLADGKTTLRKLANQFGVSDMQIHRIKTGENCSHIKTVSELKSEKKA